MPKSVSKAKDSRGVWVTKVVPTKFRIGTRKHGKSAHMMSTEDLMQVVLDDNKSKWHASAIQVINLRTNV